MEARTMQEPPDHLLKSWYGYFIAVVATTATLGVRFALNEPLEGQPALVIFTVPIMVSAYFGGARVGLFATALALSAASYFLLPPIHGFAISSGGERWQLFFVALAGVVISLLNDALHGARRSACDAMQQHREGERALREGEERYRAVVEWTPAPIIVHRNGNVVFVNPSAIEMFGAGTGQELIGKPLLDLIHPESHEASLAWLDQRKRGLDRIPLTEIRVIRLDGKTSDVEVQATSITLDGEDSIIASFHDITQQKLHAKEFERLNRMYAALSHVSQAIVRMPGRDELFHDVCQILIERGGVRMAWIGWRNAVTNALEPVAVCGGGHSDLRSLQMAAAAQPQLIGPSIRAFEEGRAQICEDMLADAATLS
ncbi:MAG: PAS domain S-box protein, partial [Phycisphaerae bacterium]|nr:PAS domain S-box protein [Gemmatimonadaceae bacterium]